MPDRTLLVHLSDLHFGPHARFAALDPREVAQMLSEAIDRATASFWPGMQPSVFVVTGDITESGKRSEFDQARVFFEAFVSHHGLGRERFVFLPGNHDLSWTECKRVVLDQEEEGFDDAELRRKTNERKFANFDAFLRAFDPACDTYRERLRGGAVAQKIPGLPLSFVMANSCEPETHRPQDHYGEVGEEQAGSIHDYWSGRLHDTIRILSLHHPPLAALPENVESANEALKKSGLPPEMVDRYTADLTGIRGAARLRHLTENAQVSLLLHGHQHAIDRNAWPWRRGDGYTHVLSAGSTGAGKSHLPTDQPNSAHLVLLEPSSPKFHAVSLVYEPRIWRESTLRKGGYVVDPVEPNGYVKRLDVPAALLETSHAKTSRRTSQPITERVVALVREYRQRMSSHYQRWDLSNTGVTPSAGATGRMVEATLDDMYLPLRFAEGVHEGALGNELTPKLLLQRKSGLVIRGAAGSGKTTWMRWTFRRLLDEAACFPILIELRRLAQRWTTQVTAEGRTIEGYLEDCIVENVGAGWRGALMEILRAPGGARPVILVDGWDELGEMGEDVRHKLLGLQRALPNVLVVVSSRPYGQSRPSHSEGYELLDVQPLANGEILQFSENFWTKCFGGDQNARLLAHQAFSEAVNRAPDARALARTPLLLTMMLLISRTQPLPDKRHQLYEACIVNLLAALPDRRQHEGAQLSRDQWRPDNSEERMRVLARLAYTLQTSGLVNDRRSIVASFDKFADLLAFTGWNLEQRRGFVAWLTGPAALLLDRADESLHFVHLSFQEFLSAWHLQGTVEGAAERLAGFRTHVGRVYWWETLRLWCALEAAKNPEKVERLLDALATEKEEAFWFCGAVYADSLGGDDGFEAWADAAARLVVYPVADSTPLARQECERAWTMSRQQERRRALVKRAEARADGWVAESRALRWKEDLGAPVARRGDLPKWPGWLNYDSLAVRRLIAGADPHEPSVGRNEAWPFRLWPGPRPLVTTRLQMVASIPRLWSDRELLTYICSNYHRSASMSHQSLVDSFLSRVVPRSWRLSGTAQETPTERALREKLAAAAPFMVRDIVEGTSWSGVDLASEALDTAADPLQFWLDRESGGMSSRESVVDTWFSALSGYWPSGIWERLSHLPNGARWAEFWRFELASSGQYALRALLAFDLLPLHRRSTKLELLKVACRVSLGVAAPEELLRRRAARITPFWRAFAASVAGLETAEHALSIGQADPTVRGALSVLVNGSVVTPGGQLRTTAEICEELGVACPPLAWSASAP